ncbi:MAG: DNA-deoxyinosine glycosylase [Clostridia bacterium]
MDRIKCFPPIVDEKSRIIVLGSMPGRESLRKNEYYGHPRNQFWNIIYSLFGREPDEEYEKKVAFLREKGIALWDVIKSCRREGSMDANITCEEVNDFDWLFGRYPGIRHVFFNGGKAYDTFRKRVGFKYEGVGYTKLGSTSPANVKPFESRLEEWGIIKKYLSNIQRHARNSK